ncbi:E3 ubiquitin-protein ligase TRIM39-like isoform X2 [Carcharodon carcharias]|uniref:E3 ubiquitin-protein ligase TRIM39-like isoform X2 n=1 Tax=Carcharodon carcharias TaxID=13397 RepID=UPI001B7DC507|nr:E3 ubiquitin-protein ligase TRIM39-like isoform X2 [Carcharodon carcharias]
MDPEGLKDELICAVCLQVYQDPVILPCQHSFCLKCIERVWVHTAGPGRFECPQCRCRFDPRPSLKRNFTLCDIVEKYNHSQPPAGHVMCDYCDSNPNPAVKTCLKCEISLCSLHLKPHLQNKAFSGHTLIEPVSDLTDRQCPDHKDPLIFYCKDDAKCVCVSCAIIGKHKSHTLLSLNEAQAAIKEELETEIKKLQEVQQNCSSKQRGLERSETEVKNSKQLLSRVTESQKVTDPDVPEFTLNLSNIFQLIQERLNGCEKYHSDILEIIMPASTKYRGPLDIMPPPHSPSGTALRIAAGISRRTGISQGKSSLSLDPKTANCNLVLSDDLRSVTWTERKQFSLLYPKRFKHYPQVLCSQSFSSGSHSWDVETDGNECGIGIACGTVEREGRNSFLGNSNKSWCLYCGFSYLKAWHNSQFTDLPLFPSKPRIRVQLDYEAGTLSFYRVTDSVRYLHTFQTTFTEPVFPAFYCGRKCLKLLN